MQPKKLQPFILAKKVWRELYTVARRKTVFVLKDFFKNSAAEEGCQLNFTNSNLRFYIVYSNWYIIEYKHYFSI